MWYLYDANDEIYPILQTSDYFSMEIGGNKINTPSEPKYRIYVHKYDTL